MVVHKVEDLWGSGQLSEAYTTLCSKAEGAVRRGPSAWTSGLWWRGMQVGRRSQGAHSLKALSSLPLSSASIPHWSNPTARQRQRQRASKATPLSLQFISLSTQPGGTGWGAVSKGPIEGSQPSYSLLQKSCMGKIATLLPAFGNTVIFVSQPSHLH